MLYLRNIRAGYGKKDVLKGISFSVQQGEFVGVLGPNGSGKTTLLRVISGVIEPDEGEAKLDSFDISRLKGREIAKEIGVVPQNTTIEFPIEGIHIVLMGRYPHQKKGVFNVSYSDRDKEMAKEAMDMSNISHLEKKFANALSGGERQLLHISKAICQRPRIFLLDEATANLDIAKKMMIFRLFKRLNRDNGSTVLSIIHDINLAALFCDRFIFLKGGRVVLDGDINTVFIPERLKEVYDIDVSIVTHPVYKRPQVLYF